MGRLKNSEKQIIATLLATEEFSSFDEEVIPKGFTKKDYNILFKKFRKYL